MLMTICQIVGFVRNVLEKKIIFLNAILNVITISGTDSMKNTVLLTVSNFDDAHAAKCRTV